MMAYTEPQQWNKESGRLAGEVDKIRFIDLRFERWQVVGFGKVDEGKTFRKWRVLG